MKMKLTKTSPYLDILLHRNKNELKVRVHRKSTNKIDLIYFLFPSRKQNKIPSNKQNDIRHTHLKALKICSPEYTLEEKEYIKILSNSSTILYILHLI